MQPAPSPSWRRRSTCSLCSTWEQTYRTNWPLASPHHEYKPPTGPPTGDDLTWSNGWVAIGMHLDIIAKQYKKGTSTSLERGKNGFGKRSRTSLERGKNRVRMGAKSGFKWHKKRNLARFDNLEQCGTAVLRCSASFHPFFCRSTPFFTRFL